MKIGILTFHRATNYGAVLQAYALVSYLKSIGHDVKIVDYKTEGMGNLYASFKVPGVALKLKRVILNLLMLPSLRARKEKRDMYWAYILKELPLTNPVIEEENFPVLDAIFVGSDQVWSTCFTDGVDKYYWGQFDRKGAKLISYAGSAAEDMEGSFYSSNNVQLLKKFDYISVREDELKEFLDIKMPEKKITKVLDPTLMVGRSYFEELIKNTVSLPRPYILIYQVVRTKDNEIQKFAKKLAQEKHYDIVEIINSRLHICSNNKIAISKELVNPTVFVSLFKYAEYIATTSFHGTAFSILFNRPFNVISVSPKVDSRAKDILTQLNIADRMIELPHSETDYITDWESINLKLKELQLPSRAFISESLK